jgi:two-component system, LytTR family, sensor histidine kinase AlgZ
MSSKSQFTQAPADLPLCRLKTAVLALLVVDAIIGVVALMSAANMAEVLRLLYQYAFWINPAVLLTLAITCATQRRMRARANSLNPAPELEEANLQHLSAAIRPHFFFNALNAVMGLIRVDPKKAESVLQDTAELFRSVMAQHDNRLVTLATELETCEQYARIEQARLAQRLTLDWQVDAALSQISVPPFSLQPLIENAIRHGIEPLAKGGKVLVQVQRSGQNAVLRVSNPIVSELERYASTKSKQHNGIALENIAARLALMYDQAAQFEHGVVEGRYEAQITIPLEFAP